MSNIDQITDITCQWTSKLPINPHTAVANYAIADYAIANIDLLNPGYYDFIPVCTWERIIYE